MAVYNSSTNINEDDTDVTIINHSFLYDHNDEPISTCIPVLRRQQQANKLPNNIQPVTSKPIITNRSNSDYIFVDHAPFDAAIQIEQILEFYRKELKQESNTQLTCNRQLITRLVDFIRPVYSSNQAKMKDLDILSEEISALHDKRFLEQKEKNDQLNNKIRHLQKSIVSTPIEDDNTNSFMTNLYRINSIVDYQQWIEMEEETKKLHSLVKTQRDQIDKLVELLSQGGNTRMNNSTVLKSYTLAFCGTQTKRSVDVYKEIVDNENHYTNTNLPPLSTQEITDNVAKKCSLCHYEFPITFTTDQIINHFEKCLSAPVIDVHNVAVEPPQQLICPYCNQKLSSTDDIAYLQHVSQCCNEITDNF